jgi:hypothetical protein
VLWYTKPKALLSDQRPEQYKPDTSVDVKKPEARKPEAKKLYYGTIPDESRLHTLASLCGLMNVAGVSILDDPDKVEALLKEYSKGRYENERNVLILALKDNVPQELLKSQKGFAGINTSTRLRKRLMKNHKMSEELARWAIETWAKALETQK